MVSNISTDFILQVQTADFIFRVVNLIWLLKSYFILKSYMVTAIFGEMFHFMSFIPSSVTVCFKVFLFFIIWSKAKAFMMINKKIQLVQHFKVLMYSVVLLELMYTDVQHMGYYIIKWVFVFVKGGNGKNWGHTSILSSLVECLLKHKS